MKENTIKLEEVIIDIAAGPFGSNLKVSCFVDDGFPIIDGANLKGFKVTDNITKFVTEEKANSLYRSIAHRNDVVVTISGTLGQIAYIPEDSMYEAYLCSQRQFRVTFDAEKVFVPYIVYYFHTYEGQHKILSFANQTGVPALSQPLKNFKNIEVKLPAIEVQKKIASVALSLDDKIELNNRINENLEQQAQAIFKSWFVDFEPFGGVMPEDWKIGNLLDIADYLNGLAMQKFRPNENENSLPVLKIKELRQGFCDNTSDLCSENIKSEYIIHDGDVIFSWSGSLLVDFWCGGTCGLNQHLFKVTSEKYNKWFYYSWTQYHLQKFISIAKDMATTMGHIKRQELKKSEVLIPNSEDYSKIENLLSPIYDVIIANRIENKRIEELRDTLLPKLMNGEIDVSKVKI